MTIFDSALSIVTLSSFLLESVAQILVSEMRPVVSECHPPDQLKSMRKVVSRGGGVAWRPGVQLCL